MKRLTLEDLQGLIEILDAAPEGVPIAQVRARLAVSSRIAQRWLSRLKSLKRAVMVGRPGDNYSRWASTKHQATAQAAFERDKEEARVRAIINSKERDARRPLKAREPEVKPLVIPAVCDVWSYARVAA